RNKEKPRSRLPVVAEIESFLAVAKRRGAGSELIGIMGRFTALTGRRRAEFLKLKRDQVTDEGIYLDFAKDKGDEARRKGFIEWTPALRQVFDDAKAIKRPGKTPPPASVY